MNIVQDSKPFERTALAAVLRIAGRCWLTEPDQELLELFSHADVAAALEQAGLENPAAGFSNDDIESLAVEYCRLLVGPKGHIAPIESVWTEQRYEAASAGAMNRFFELLPGYQPPSRMSDHIGVQFDFVASLLQQADEGDPVDEVLSAFTGSRMQWVGPFFDAVDSTTDNTFFIRLVALSRRAARSISGIG